jgi:hypothetical protein
VSVVAAAGGLASVLIGLVILGAGVSKLRDAVEVMGGDPVSIREAAQGTGTSEFEGTVAAIDDQQTFPAPLGGEEAVLADYRVQRPKSTGGRRQGPNWTTVDSGTITRPFLVTGDTGCVAVDPTGVSVSSGDSSSVTASEAYPDDVRLRLSVCADEFDLGAILPQLETNRARRFVEGYISPGDDVHVYGARVLERTPEHPRIDARVGASGPDEQYEVTAGSETSAVRSKVGTALLLMFVGVTFVATGLLIAIA